MPATPSAGVGRSAQPCRSVHGRASGRRHSVRAFVSDAGGPSAAPELDTARRILGDEPIGVVAEHPSRLAAREQGMHEDRYRVLEA